VNVCGIRKTKPVSNGEVLALSLSDK